MADMTLRERALSAWHQTDIASQQRRAESVAANRRLLVADTLHLAETVLGVRLDESDVSLYGHDDAFILSYATCTAEITVEGERFEVLYNDALSGWTIYHHWICPECGEQPEGGPIESLCDLGFRMESLPTRCRCRIGGSDVASE